MAVGEIVDAGGRHDHGGRGAILQQEAVAADDLAFLPGLDGGDHVEPLPEPDLAHIDRLHAAMRGGPEGVAVFQGVARPVDAGPFRVPDREDAIDGVVAEELVLLRAPDGRQRQILVQAGLEMNVVVLEEFV